MTEPSVKRYALAYEAVRAFYDDCTLCSYNYGDILNDLLRRPYYVLECVKFVGRDYHLDRYPESSFQEESYYKYKDAVTKLKDYIEGLN